jgi:hypothetical protein
VFPEKRDDRSEQLVPASNDELEQVFFVVVLTSIPRYPPYPEEILELFEARAATRALGDHKSMEHLVTGDVALAGASIRLPNEADGEATLPIYKAYYPASPDQPFLLIFRTHRIVTAHTYMVGRVPVGYSGFPAYSRMQTATLL